MQHLMKFNKKKIKYSIINIVLIIASYFIILYIEGNFGTSSEAIAYLSNTGTILFVGYILLYYGVSGKVLCPYVYFYISFFIFQFGQCALYGLGINYQHYMIFYYDSELLIQAIKLTVLCLGLLNLGAILAHREYPKTCKQLDKCSAKDIAKLSKIIFYLLACYIMPLACYKFWIGVHQGYYGVREFVSRTNFIITFAEYMFVPFGLLFYAYTDSRRAKMNAIIFIFIWGIFTVFTGYRTIGLAAILVAFLNNDIMVSGINKIKKKGNVKKIIAIALLVFLLITVVRIYRSTDERQDKGIGDIAREAIAENIVVNAIGEMGYSIMPLIMTMKIIPQYADYHYGETYGAAILSSVFPESLDLTGIIKKLTETANLSGWLTDYYNLSYGTGYSLIAESYANFGMWGFWIFVIIGYIIGKLLDLPSKGLEKESLFRKYVRIVMLFVLLTSPRREMYHILYNCFYLIICVAIFLKLFFSQMKYGEKTSKYIPK